MHISNTLRDVITNIPLFLMDPWLTALFSSWHSGLPPNKSWTKDSIYGKNPQSSHLHREITYSSILCGKLVALRVISVRNFWTRIGIHYDNYHYHHNDHFEWGTHEKMSTCTRQLGKSKLWADWEEKLEYIMHMDTWINFWPGIVHNMALHVSLCHSVCSNWPMCTLKHDGRPYFSPQCATVRKRRLLLNALLLLVGHKGLHK